MTKFAIERNGSLVNHVVFKNNSILYRDTDVVPLVFDTHKAATEVADVINGTVIDYHAYLQQQLAA